MTLRIGLVLASLPSYSETFINTKIWALTELGHHLIIFVPNSNLDNVLNLKVVESLPLKLYDFRIRDIWRFLFLVFCKFRPLIRYLRIELKDGTSFPNSFKKMYLNSHFFLQKLDWLHFGFGTLVRGRENVAASVGARMGVSFRGFDIFASPFKYPGLYNKLWKTTFKIHYLSEAIRQKAIELGCDPSNPGMKISPAVNSNIFRNAPLRGKIKKHLKILTVARLQWQKGLEYAIDAMGKLKKEGLEFQYTIIGDGNEYERLCYAAYQNNVVDEVKFEGAKDQQYIYEVMSLNDIFLMPSVSEGFCNAVLEAQATGLLCIVTDAGGLAENVLDGKTGWVVKRRSVTEIVQKFKYVLNEDNEKLNYIRQNALERVHSEFCLGNLKTKWNQFFQIRG